MTELGLVFLCCNLMYNWNMKFFKKNLNRLISLALLVVAPVISFAVGDVPGPCIPTAGKICNPISQDSIAGFIQTFLTGILRVGIPIVALAVIYCGFLFVAARGNTEKLSKAKDALLYTLIGAGILLGSWAIAILISETVLKSA